MTSRKNLLAYLESLQEIQKTNPPESLAWIKASKEIHATAKLFHDMDRLGMEELAEVVS